MTGQNHNYTEIEQAGDTAAAGAVGVEGGEGAGGVGTPVVN